MTAEELVDAIRHWLRLNEQERAVIEAAKAVLPKLVATWDLLEGAYPVYSQEVVDSVLAAITALGPALNDLQAAEKGE